MIKNGNSLAEFSAEVLIENAGSKITKDEMYLIYCKWCLDHKPKLSPSSKVKIGRSLTKFTPYTNDSKSGSERYWLNVSCRDRWDTFLKNMRVYSESNKADNSSSNNNIYNISKSVPTAPFYACNTFNKGYAENIETIKMNNPKPISKKVSEMSQLPKILNNSNLKPQNMTDDILDNTLQELKEDLKK